jgi:hypothetical protein
MKVAEVNDGGSGCCVNAQSECVSACESGAWKEWLTNPHND